MAPRPCALLLGILVAVMAMAAPAWSRVDYYVRNVKIVDAHVEEKGEVYVPLDSLMHLFAGAVREVSSDAEGAVTVDGKPAPLQALQRRAKTWYPVLGLARHLGWGVQSRPDLGIVDVTSPTRVRVAEAARGDQPVDAREKALAEAGSRKVLVLYGGASEDKALQERVDQIGQRLARASGRPGIPWHFTVLRSRRLQACSVGLGYVFITRGLAEICDDGELAGVLAHEIAHGVARHSTRPHDVLDMYRYYLRMAGQARARQQAIKVEPGGMSPGAEFRYQAAVREEQEYRAKAAEAAERIRNWQGHDSWDQEYEADRLGMLYAHNAGFPALGLCDALDKIARSMPDDDSGLRGIEQATTHPPIADRMRIAVKVYRDWFVNGGAGTASPRH